MKILKRNYGHRNLIVFLILSLVYLQAIYSLSNGHSIFSMQSLRLFFLSHYLILALTLITAYMVIKIKKWSEFVLLFCLITIVGKNFILLSNSFNKLSLALNFIYLVFAFYFFITWEIEVSLASFNPEFSRHDLEKESRFRLKAQIFITDKKENIVPVRISNIDEESCFLLMPEGAKLKLDSSQLYTLESTISGVTFHHNAYLVSSYDRGIGLVFEKASDARLSWSELYKVCLERGIVV
jgi:hypothetical protein